jgi:sulfur carrier protein ThiS
MSYQGPDTVTVETFPARRGRPPVELSLTEGLTLDELLERLQIPSDTEAVIVNGVYVRPDYLLQPGDRVRIIPFMSGG